MCYNRNLFVNLKPSAVKIVKLAEKDTISQVPGEGDIILFNKLNNNLRKIVLKNVLYVPNLSENLISVGCFDLEGYNIMFKDKSCKIFSANRELLLTGSLLRNNIYKLNLDNYNENVCNLAQCMAIHTQSSAIADVNLWHKRLGHVNFTHINQLQNNAATGMKFYGDPKSCQTLVEEKLWKKPFKQSHSRAEQKLEIIHTDLCQVDSPSMGEAIYFLTFVDDHSRKIFLKS